MPGRRTSVARRPAVVEGGRIGSMTHEGKGIADNDGKKVFVSGALPGELVDYQPVKRRRSYDEAVVQALHEVSADRVEPRCKVFGICGGCSLQHLSHEGQLMHKQTVLRDSLLRIGKVDPGTLADPIRGAVWSYRRKARLGVKYVHRKERVLVGFRERLKPYIADMQRCEVLSEGLESLPEVLAELIGKLSLASELPQVELAVGDETVALVFRILKPATDKDLRHFHEFAELTGYQVMLQPGGLGSVAPLSHFYSVAAPGGPPLSYSLQREQVTFEFLPTDFVQINRVVNEQLVNKAIDLLELAAGDRVLDLFCGIGNFSLALARHAEFVMGVEGAQELVSRARQNAERNGIQNVEFQVADLSKLQGNETWLAGSYDKILIDPARAGAQEVLPFIVAMKPQRLVYVSCHPATLARDIGILVNEHGYRLRSAGIVDMFPHTAHVESIATLEGPA